MSIWKPEDKRLLTAACSAMLGDILSNRLLVRKIAFILIMILPLTVSAKFGWSFNDYSFLFGQQYRIGQNFLWGIDFQYDRYRKNCLARKRYFGFGANYSFNSGYYEVGIKGMWNPTNLLIMPSRTIKFYPYLFGQGNYTAVKVLNNISPETATGYSIRPGIGLTGNIRDNKVLSIRTYLQAGYNIPFNNTQSFKSSLTIEFKVGIGINSRKLKRDKQPEEDESS